VAAVAAASAVAAGSVAVAAESAKRHLPLYIF
jgi:hypothetical protein